MDVTAARRSESPAGVGAFARRLRERRLGIPLTQQSLARQLGGVTGRTVGNWERGTALPAPRHYKALAEFMQLPGPTALMALFEADDDGGPAEASKSAPVLTIHPGAKEADGRNEDVSDGLALLTEFWRSRLSERQDEVRSLSNDEWAALQRYTVLLETLVAARS